MTTYDIQVRPMREFETDVRWEAAKVFVEGYYKELSFLSKDHGKLAETFGQMMCPDVFYLAVLDHEVVGILACSNHQKRALTMDKGILRRSFGVVKGSISYLFTKNEFNTKLPYPEGIY